jgi:hypothetical protein
MLPCFKEPFPSSMIGARLSTSLQRGVWTILSNALYVTDNLKILTISWSCEFLLDSSGLSYFSRWAWLHWCCTWQMKPSRDGGVPLLRECRRRNKEGALIPQWCWVCGLFGSIKTFVFSMEWSLVCLSCVLACLRKYINTSSISFFL